MMTAFRPGHRRRRFDQVDDKLPFGRRQGSEGRAREDLAAFREDRHSQAFPSFGSERTGAPVVAYCRGPFCVYADDAVRALRRRGYRAARLEEGFPEWARDGLPLTPNGRQA